MIVIAGPLMRGLAIFFITVVMDTCQEDFVMKRHLMLVQRQQTNQVGWRSGLFCMPPNPD
jgi:hypothetical protein